MDVILADRGTGREGRGEVCADGEDAAGGLVFFVGQLVGLVGSIGLGWIWFFSLYRFLHRLVAAGPWWMDEECE